jgi:hypothetical protein
MKALLEVCEEDWRREVREGSWKGVKARQRWNGGEARGRRELARIARVSRRSCQRVVSASSAEKFLLRIGFEILEGTFARRATLVTRPSHFDHRRGSSIATFDRVTLS